MAKIYIAFALFLLVTARSFQSGETSKLEGLGLSTIKSLFAVKSLFGGDKKKVPGENDRVANYFADLAQLDSSSLVGNDAPIEEPHEVTDEDESYDGLANFLNTDKISEENKKKKVDHKPIEHKEMTLGPVILDRGVMSRFRSSPMYSIVDLFEQGLSIPSLSTGAEVTLKLQKSLSESEGSVRLFQKGLRSNRTCSSADPTKMVLADCGSHYLFPGYTLKLKETTNPCQWNFRYSSPEIILSIEGSGLEEDTSLKEEERIVTTSMKISTSGNERKFDRSKKVFKDLVFNTPGVPTGTREKVIAEVCVPSDPEEHLAEYEAFDTLCCPKHNKKCGVASIGNIVDKKFEMHNMPWEVLLTVKGNLHSDSEDSFCSGSLISKFWVLTTASCFIRNGVIDSEGKDYVPRVIVDFGWEKETKPVIRHEISEIHIFPASTESHDIALVKLAGRGSDRMPICLPPFTKPNPSGHLLGRNALAFGWVLADQIYMSGRDQAVISSDACSDKLGKRLPPHMVCTVDTPNEPCLPDGDLLTGSQSRYVLQGLSNPRLQCEDGYRPHTSVAYFMKWISNVTQITMPL